MNRPPLWLADWSDSEHEDFEAACRAAGIEPRVVRSRPLGTSVGRTGHRLRSWPAYARLAAQGLATAHAPIVAWQPLAGALAGLLRPRRRPALVVLNPLLRPDDRGPQQRLVLGGLGRAERVVLFSRRAVDAAVSLGLDPDRLRFVPLGVRARVPAPPPPGRFLVAVGREHRDWDTLAAAARGLHVEVRVLGPRSLPARSGLTLLPPMERSDVLGLIAEAAAVVVPLARPDRTSGQLAVLDAMSVGRGVVATTGQGTEDYVTPETGFLVPPQDPDALREALVAAAVPATAARLGAAALAAARGPLSLERFVTEVDELARTA